MVKSPYFISTEHALLLLNTKLNADRHKQAETEFGLSNLHVFKALGSDGLQRVSIQIFFLNYYI